MNKEETCENCKCVKIEIIQVNDHPVRKEKTITCHRYPPSTSGAPHYGELRYTNLGDWCGEWMGEKNE